MSVCDNTALVQRPSERYRRDLENDDIQPDPAQQRIITRLDALYDALLQQTAPRKGLLNGLLRREPPWPGVSGLYLWGPVGRGKTYLMDSFFQGLPLAAKRRTHFYRFMQGVHTARKRHRHEQDPVGRAAVELARRVRVLCFDEFFVSDIADAMILGRFLEVLFERGVTLMATSNVPPDDLYKDGLQRTRFLPTIDLLKEHVEVLELDTPHDFRLRELKRLAFYVYPLGPQAEDALERIFARLADGDGERDVTLTIQNRPIPCRRVSPTAAWFDFEALVGGPRSPADYMEIGSRFEAVLVSNVPQLDNLHENDSRRFISLVDEFYDRRVKLAISAAVPVHRLYSGERVKFEFERTISRLTEMQSENYLSLPHRPA